MSFLEGERIRLPCEATGRYTSYWHAMHPVTFKPKDLYRAAWPDDVWDAIQLLMKKHGDVVTPCYHFTYMADFSGYKNKPDWIPKHPTLTFRYKKARPYINVKEEHVGPKVAMEMRRWILKAHHFHNQKQFLHANVLSLVKLKHSHYDARDREVKLAQVNTPRILHGVWPEITPFLDDYNRDEIRGNRNKVYPIPRNWTGEMLKKFREQDGMEDLNNALLAIGLIDDCTDKKYPELSGR